MSAGRAVSLQPIAERLRRGAVGRERPQEPRDEPRSARSHGTATAKAHTTTAAHPFYIFNFTFLIPGERGTRGLFTTACGARSAELADTDTHKNPVTSRGARAVTARRQPRPTHNHCRPSILNFQFYIPHPRRARDARFLYNRSRSAYGAELSDANAHKNPVTSRGARAVTARRQPRPTHNHCRPSILHSPSPIPEFIPNKIQHSRVVIE